MIYFDSAATTLQKPASVPAAVADAIHTMTTPGRGDHPAARLAADLMLRCRMEAAALFDVPQPENVILTSNATHALNIAIRSLVSPGDTVAVSGYEHNAVTRPLRDIGGVVCRIVNGRLFDPRQMAEGFRRAVSGGVKAAICTHTSNVFGYTLPIEEIAAICREKGVPLIVDASQSAGIQPVSLRRWGAAYVAMPGHKGLYGPQGTGLLLCGEGQTPRPLLAGGTGSLSRQQEMPDFLPDRLEAGTQNVHGAAGLLAGIQFVRSQGLEKIRQKEGEVIRALASGLEGREDFRVFADPAGGGSVLSVLPLQEAPETLADRLAEQGVAVRSGLHCAPLAHRTAGTEDTGTLRFSASVFNTPEEAEMVLRIL
ncbi:MAG: aminotransferase class V-fold PLP-dependent enzyme [Oscillospiraceae bacterium]|nr:aminotransferase class V-fold PLP-dependent enzyme [Oscillospiraceae bacterium]